MTIYDLHSKAFSNVSAFVVMREKRKSDDTGTELERVATIAMKYPRDGASRQWCYLHVLGLPMVRGYAGGCGYDKNSAAFQDAAARQCGAKLESWQTSDYSGEYRIAALMRDSFNGREGHDWQANLRHAGFIVLQAV